MEDLHFLKLFLLEIDDLMGDSGHEWNADDWDVNSPYNMDSIIPIIDAMWGQK